MFYLQTRSLLSVFEEDAGMLTDYTNQLLQSMQRVFGAQMFGEGTSSACVLVLLSIFLHNLYCLVQLNSLHSELANQMADSMVFPLIQFREKDLTVLLFSSAEHEAAMVKYSRLPKKKENEKLKADLVKEVAYTRRKQHQASLQYYCALNALQYRKRVAMLEPMLGYTQAQISFFKKGIELVSKKMDNFLTSVSKMTQSIQAQLDTEAEGMRMAQRELLSVEDNVYMPDKDTEPVNRTLIQKAGYLNIRNKTGLVTTAWDRLYFFTQGGNLMCQPRGAVAGGMVLDLDNSSVMAVDCEDRRYCFQITSPSGKTLSLRKQIYLTDNPEAVAIRLNQSAIQAVTPITSFEKRQEGSPNPDRSDFTQKTESAPEPEDLIAPGTPIQFDIMLPASEFQDQNRAGGRRTNPFGETDDDCSIESDDSLLQQVFAVRFQGSMAVRCGNNQEVIYEAMRQVLAARAIHNIFRTTESHLMVTSSSLRLIDPQTQVTRISFQLGEVCQFAAHQENGRLMGFVVEGRDWSDGNEEGEPSFSAFIFESNTEGEKICYTITLAKDIAEAKKDPEALAELMKNMPLTNDGKFLLLEPEMGDTTNGAGHEDLESEA
uniref:Adaptor protein, phosphotyrosine interacting with PH domain and leucine zipper 2 n=1 Tax=Mastacembelus armatus TaxID=205130 RepID=A0A7N8XUU7_9TELE